MAIAITLFLVFDTGWKKSEYVQKYKNLIPEKTWYIVTAIICLGWIIAIPLLLLAPKKEEPLL